jgi:hypothetical protein
LQFRLLIRPDGRFIDNMATETGWQNFYNIVGSAAGALIGLQFVVMTLLTNMRTNPVNAQAGTSYTTPNVVHFGAVLLLSALISAPWTELVVPAVIWGVLGAIGLAYIVVVALRLQASTVYQAVFEDWLFHVLLPLAAYAMFGGSAGLVFFHPRAGMFVLGTAVLLLLFVGIHNAWDLVTYHVFVRRPADNTDGQNAEGHVDE